MPTEFDKRLLGKKYRKPQDCDFYQQPSNREVEPVSDWIFMQGFMTFVLNIPEPGSRFFAVGDDRVFNRGDQIMVDTHGGFCEIVRIVRIDKREKVLYLDRNIPKPLVGGDVFKVIGSKTAVIDRGS